MKAPTVEKSIWRAFILSALAGALVGGVLTWGVILKFGIVPGICVSFGIGLIGWLVMWPSLETFLPFIMTAILILITIDGPLLARTVVVSGVGAIHGALYLGLLFAFLSEGSPKRGRKETKIPPASRP